jgi:hypothetical protein
MSPTLGVQLKRKRELAYRAHPPIYSGESTRLHGPLIHLLRTSSKKRP